MSKLTGKKTPCSKRSVRTRAWFRFRLLLFFINVSNNAHKVKKSHFNAASRTAVSPKTCADSVRYTHVRTDSTVRRHRHAHTPREWPERAGGTGAPTPLALTATIEAGWGAGESWARKRKGRGALTEDAETEKQAGLGAAGDSPGQGRLPGSRPLGSERPPRPSATPWKVTDGRKQTPHRVEWTKKSDMERDQDERHWTLTSPCHLSSLRAAQRRPLRDTSPPSSTTNTTGLKKAEGGFPTASFKELLIQHHIRSYWSEFWDHKGLRKKKMSKENYSGFYLKELN